MSTNTTTNTSPVDYEAVALELRSLAAKWDGVEFKWALAVVAAKLGILQSEARQAASWGKKKGLIVTRLRYEETEMVLLPA